MRNYPLHRMGDLAYGNLAARGKAINFHKVVTSVRHHDMNVGRRMVEGSNLNAAIRKTDERRHGVM